MNCSRSNRPCPILGHATPPAKELATTHRHRQVVAKIGSRNVRWFISSACLLTRPLAQRLSGSASCSAASDCTLCAHANSVCVCVSRWDRHRRGCIRTRACSGLDLVDPSLEDVHNNVLELEVVALELRERLGQDVGNHAVGVDQMHRQDEALEGVAHEVLPGLVVARAR